MPSVLRTGARAGIVAGTLSGIPSTLYALIQGRDPLEASVAAGSIVLPLEQRKQVLLVAAGLVHSSLSVGWATLLATALPHERTLLWAGLGGLGIAALDLGLLGRAFPRVRALPVGPQIADHLAFGIVAGAVIARARRGGLAPQLHGTVGSHS